MAVDLAVDLVVDLAVVAVTLVVPAIAHRPPTLRAEARTQAVCRFPLHRALRLRHVVQSAVPLTIATARYYLIITLTGMAAEYPSCRVERLSSTHFFFLEHALTALAALQPMRPGSCQ